MQAVVGGTALAETVVRGIALVDAVVIWSVNVVEAPLRCVALLQDALAGDKLRVPPS